MAGPRVLRGTTVYCVQGGCSNALGWPHYSAELLRGQPPQSSDKGSGQGSNSGHHGSAAAAGAIGGGQGPQCPESSVRGKPQLQLQLTGPRDSCMATSPRQQCRSCPCCGQSREGGRPIKPGAEASDLVFVGAGASGLLRALEDSETSRLQWLQRHARPWGVETQQRPLAQH